MLLANYGDIYLDETSAQFAALPSADDRDRRRRRAPRRIAVRALFSPDGAAWPATLPARSMPAWLPDGLAIDYETFKMTRYELAILGRRLGMRARAPASAAVHLKDLRDAPSNPRRTCCQRASAKRSVLTARHVARAAGRVIPAR